MKREMRKETRKVIEQPRAIDLPAESVPSVQILEALGVNTAPADVIRSTLESVNAANVMIARVSPGCQAVPIEAQKVLFSLLDAQSIGVTLTDSLLMIPMKSISLILPLAEALPERLRVFSMCHTCRRSETCMRIIL